MSVNLFNSLLIILFSVLLISVEYIDSESLETHLNINLNSGDTAHLKCPLKEKNESDNSVQWVRRSDRHILTNGFIKYTSDSRFSPHFQNNHWILQIRNVNINDTGVYECRINAKNTSTHLTLVVQDPKTNELKNIMKILEMSPEEQNEQIKQLLNRAEQMIKKAEDPSGNLNPAFIVNEFLPDPLPVKPFNVSEDGGLTYFEGRFNNMSIHGLKQMKINKLLFNLGLTQLKVIMEIPVISLKGIYDLEGQITFMSLYGDGDFYMNITGIEVNTYSALTKTDDGKINVSDLDLDVYTENIELHLDNLMGGGVMGGITNTIVNQMSGLIFDHVKNVMVHEASADIKKMINTQLSHLPLDFLDKDSATIFDGMLERVARGINESHLDPMSLPAFRDKFNYSFMVFKINGELKITNGYLSGLSSLVRTGDIIATYSNNEVVFEARMGFNNLTGGYDWSTNVMGGGPSGSSSINLAGISSFIQLKQSLKKGAKPRISSFKIERIEHLWIDVNGLGSWDFILEIIMNLVSNAFKLSLANAISGPVTQAIQKELNNLPITFL